MLQVVGILWCFSKTWANLILETKMFVSNIKLTHGLFLKIYELIFFSLSQETFPLGLIF